ncbi:hypothetical protein BD779DRAFT_1408558, partial [Infundibulicybe gibba]
FLERNGKQRAFHMGGNSSCRQHIRGHYDIYEERCKLEGIPMHHWAIPHGIWKEMK